MIGKRRQPFRATDFDLGICAEARREPCAHARRRFDQDQAARLGRHDVRMQSLAAAVIEHDGARCHVAGEVLGDAEKMDVAVARIDVDRVRGVVEIDPVIHGLSAAP